MPHSAVVACGASASVLKCSCWDTTNVCNKADWQNLGPEPLGSAQPASHPSSQPIFPCCVPRAGSRSLEVGWLGHWAAFSPPQAPQSTFIPVLSQLRTVDRQQDGKMHKDHFAALIWSSRGHSCSLEPGAVRPNFFPEVSFSHSMHYLETSLQCSFCQEAF